MLRMVWETYHFKKMTTLRQSEFARALAHRNIELNEMDALAEENEQLKYDVRFQLTERHQSLIQKHLTLLKDAQRALSEQLNSNERSKEVDVRAADGGRVGTRDGDLRGEPPTVADDSGS